MARKEILLVYWDIPCQEYARNLAEELDTFAAEVRKVELKKGEGVERVKRIRKKG